MSNIEAGQSGDNSTQSQTDPTQNVVAEPPTEKPKEINVGEEIHESTHVPDPELIEAAQAAEQKVMNSPPVNTPQQSEDAVFNPHIHAVDAAGNPVMKEGGGYAKKRGRKPGQKSGGGNTEAIPVAGEVVNDFNNPAPPTTVEAVSMLFGMLCMINCKAIGPEWAPSKEEAQMMVDVWSRYIHYKGWDGQLTPEFAVILATAGFLAPRVMHPNFINKFINRKKVNAHVNSRPTGNGKNNTGENNSQTGNGTRAGGVSG